MKLLLDHMDERKRDELLIRIDERLKRIESRDAAYDKRCMDHRAECVKAINAKLTIINSRIDQAIVKSDEALKSSVGVVSWKARAAAFTAGVVGCAGWAVAIWKLVQGGV